ncbi:MAG: aldehyde ferredoxin oxidoreductase C-terminal domain-containing protein [Bacillota bacterium]|nr:aldehyde ferredoxin oxidoreductase C-terminal domain-containing protein [Bacillota bacterium]
MAKIVRVNLTKEIIVAEESSEKYSRLGGRALTSRIIADEVDPTCEPLGLHNKLVFAPGLFSGSFLSSSSRISVGGKSPLTGGIKEANAGGTAGGALSKLGIKALIIEGENISGYSCYLYINKDKMELRPAEMAGCGLYHSARLLFERYGDKVSLILIGPGGERGYPSAGIAGTDVQGRPSRFMGRGGLGAVMGVKGLKAIVLNPEGTAGPAYHDRKAFAELNKELVKILKENPATGEGYPLYGTAAMATRTNALHALPTRNFSEGSFECADRIDGEYLYNTIKKRGGEGETTHACMPGCVIKCSNIYADSEGREIIAPLEYETIGLMGSNLGIGNLDDIARLNYICNDLGIDTIETGAALGVVMDQGLAEFGDAKAALGLLAEIENDTILGRVLAHGATVSGRILGSRRIPAVKGQAMPAYDPRSIKGLGVTYATSPMGADHTAGNTIRAQVDHLDPGSQPEISRNAQITATLADSMGFCLFLMPAMGVHLDKLSRLYEYFSGEKLTDEEMRAIATRTLQEEHDFNRRAGMNPSRFCLPEFMREEALPENSAIFDVTEEGLRKAVE